MEKTIEMILSESEIRRQYPEGTIVEEYGVRYMSTGKALPPSPATYMASYPRLVVTEIEEEDVAAQLGIKSGRIAKIRSDKKVVELKFKRVPDKKVNREKVYLERTGEYEESYEKDPEIFKECDENWCYRYYTYKETVLDDGMKEFTAYIDSVNEDMKKLKKAGYIVLNENELKEIVKSNAAWRRAERKKAAALSDEHLQLMNKAVRPVISDIKDYVSTKNYLDEALPYDLYRIIDRLNMLSEDMKMVTEKEVEQWLQQEMKMDMKQLKELADDRYDAVMS